MHGILLDVWCVWLNISRMAGTSLKIYSVGPIERVEIEDLKRINVFIGASASGKSTIAKIVSQLLWCEKAYITMGVESDFKEQLIAFHRFSDVYFTMESRIEYCSPWTTITFQRSSEKQRRFKTEYHRHEKAFYNNVKIQYIPAERNFVASIPNLQKYNDSNDNVFEFLQDWFECKGRYKDLRACYEVSDLEKMKLQFRTLQDGTLDYVRVGSSQVDVELPNCSSGIQSMLPLLLVADAVLDKKLKKKSFSFNELRNLRKKASIEHYSVIDALNDISSRESGEESFAKAVNELWQNVGYQGDYARSFLSVEEPEQNIYPATQRSLVYHLLNRLSESSSLMITTHSPYILYAFDNALVAGSVCAHASARKRRTLESEFPNVPVMYTQRDVALWLVENGRIVSLIDPETHCLGENEFNRQLGISVDEMAGLYFLLGEAGDEEQK